MNIKKNRRCILCIYHNNGICKVTGIAVNPVTLCFCLNFKKDERTVNQTKEGVENENGTV